MPARPPTPTIRAAGGVVWRPRKNSVEIALVHRPRYDDWTLPKGKLDPGETELAAAVREVSEELGSTVAVSRRVTSVTYLTGSGRKHVTYWAMRHVEGSFVPNTEVDEARWLSPKEARGRLSYSIDRDVLADFLAAPAPDSVIVVVRHAKAGRRAQWAGPDVERPLEAAGQVQADRLVPFLRCFAPNAVIAGTPVRCQQTVAPFAEAVGLNVAVDPAFSDATYERSPATSETALLSLAKPGKVSVVCSQGLTIPGLIDTVAPAVRSSDTRKGAAWVLSMVDGTVVSADYYADAAR